MPTYDYQCTSCEHEFEAFQQMSEEPLTDCPSCAAPALKRKIGRGAGFIFKGSGFYETDFKDRSGFSEAAKEKPKPEKTSSESTSSTSTVEPASITPAKSEAAPGPKKETTAV